MDDDFAPPTRRGTRKNTDDDEMIAKMMAMEEENDNGSKSEEDDDEHIEEVIPKKTRSKPQPKAKPKPKKPTTKKSKAKKEEVEVIIFYGTKNLFQETPKVMWDQEAAQKLDDKYPDGYWQDFFADSIEESEGKAKKITRIEYVNEKHPLKLVKTLDNPGAVYSARFSPNYELFATCTNLGVLRVWDAVEFSLIAELRDHNVRNSQKCKLTFRNLKLKNFTHFNGQNPLNMLFVVAN